MSDIEDFKALTPGEQWRNAILIGNFEDGGDEWHGVRSGRYGGSDIATILGRGFVSRYLAWYQRFGNVAKDPIDPAYAFWGHAHEPTLIRMFEHYHPELEVVVPGSFEHADNALRLANPDGLIFHRADGSFYGILELKTSEMGYGWGDKVESTDPNRPDGTEIVPDKYKDQVNSYMDAFDATIAHFAVLVSGCRYREATVEYDGDKEWRNKAVNAFEESGRAGIPPEYDGASGTLDFIRSQHPEIDKKEVYYLSQRQRDDLIFALSEKARVEGLENRIKAELLDKAGKQKAAKLQVGDKVVAIRTARGNGAPFLQLKEKVSDNPIEAVKA